MNSLSVCPGVQTRSSKKLNDAASVWRGRRASVLYEMQLLD
jgi:hypothetical protein